MPPSPRSRSRPARRDPAGGAVLVRDARFQQWEALLTNRQKRQRGRRFLVQGVRPIGVAVAVGWPLEALLYPTGRELSGWARSTLDAAAAPGVPVAPELLAELGEKAEGAPELIAVAAIPPDELDRLVAPAGAAPLLTVFDRPSSPGNIGTLLRSADAFGAHGLVVSGHAADPYDPKALRASTGSLFAVPVVREGSPARTLEWLEQQGIQVLGTDETGDRALDDVDLTRPTALVVGNETSGMSAAWREGCAAVLRIPTQGSASSLNAATAASIVLYEAARQRAR